MKFGVKYVVILSVVLLVVDQLSKIWIKTTFCLNESVSVFGDWFQLRFIENPGAAYGFELGGEYGKMILTIFRLVAVSAIGVYIANLIKRNAPRGVVVGFTLILVGALGNVFDSLFYGLIFSESTYFAPAVFTAFGQGYGTFLHGNVVDMLYFPIIRIDMMPSWVPIWGGEPFVFFSPIFNIADSYISVALIYLLIFQRKFFK